MIGLALRRHVDRAMGHCLDTPMAQRHYFAAPLHEEALIPALSVSWRVFKNPVALFVGGIAAVILELAEPGVCAGVWGHSSFRADPARRLRHTGLVALATVYAARSVAEPMIAGVVRMHASIRGTTAGGLTYSASDPALLAWVHATAAFGFVEAYRCYVEPLSEAEHDRFYAEGAPIARLYGALTAPVTSREMNFLIEQVALRHTPVVREFLRIMATGRLLPGIFRWLQPLLVRAAVDLLPATVRARLCLGGECGLRPGEHLLTRWAGAAANRMVLAESPAVQSCVRLGLRSNFLYT